MKANKFRKHAGIITILLFLAAFIPSALSQVEWNGVTKAGAGESTRTAVEGPIGISAGGATFTGIGVGTIATGKVIAEAALIAVAASQSNASNVTTIH